MSGKPRFRYLLHIEFDGTNFSGWQKQKDARTVQGDLLKTAVNLFADPSIDLQGAGRTDKGVHGLVYAAHVDSGLEFDIPAARDLLNEALPKDIAVLDMVPVDERFHARHSCVARSYLYLLHTRKSAFGKRFGWWVQKTLDLAAMREAAALFCGMHDFAAFAEKPELKKSTKALVNRVQIIESDGALVVRVVASHFLWHMVRKLVALLVEIGLHVMTVDDAKELLHHRNMAHSAGIAPAAGLYFERAFYDRRELDEFLAYTEGAAVRIMPF